MAPNPKPDYTARPGEALRVFMNDRLEFAIGMGRLSIASGDVEFVDAVSRDIGLLEHSPEGHAALLQGDALRQPVKIVKPDPPTAPPNAWILPDGSDPADASGSSAGRGSTIVYNPADWPRPGEPASPTSVEVLLIALRQANENAGAPGDSAGADRARPLAGTLR